METKLNLSWKIGDKIPSPVQNQITLNPGDLKTREIYKLMTEIIIPRPIAFISTMSSEGIGNLAPFSFYNGVSSNPPAVMFAITQKQEGIKKDTLINIEATHQFVINSVDQWLVGPMNMCSADYPFGVDEMQKVGLTPIASEKIKPFRIKESSINLECELYNTMIVGDGKSEGSSTIVVGKILAFHIDKNIYENSKFLEKKYYPISRLGGSLYGEISNTFNLSRPKLD